MESNAMQAYFDKTAKHLRDQGRQSKAENASVCQYRLVTDEATLRCAVGCHIPDDLYELAFEERVVDSLPESLDGIAWPSGEVGMSLAYSLQCVHDDNWNWVGNGFNQYGEADLVRVAGEYGLAYTGPETS